MGGAVSKDKLYTYSELCEISKCAIVKTWIEDEEQLINLIDDLIEAKYYGKDNDSFDRSAKSDIDNIVLEFDDVVRLNEYKEFLMKKLESYRRVICEDEETDDHHQNIRSIIG